MGLYDRDYTQEQNESRNAPQMRIGIPSLTPVVKWLLIINVAIYLLDTLISSGKANELTPIKYFFSIMPFTPALMLQVWRLITYQFLHWDFYHILFNMLGLWFLGPSLEQQWGSKRFLIFYLSCGIAGGLFYILLVLMGFLAAGPMVGASGAVLGILAACAILFPHFIVFIIIFPVPIRVAAVILMALSFFTVISKGPNAGGEACHFAGIVVAAVYVLSGSWRAKLKLRFKALRWDKYIESERRLRLEVDRILKKVHDHGIHSLTSSEKRILKKATQFEQERLRK